MPSWSQIAKIHKKQKYAELPKEDKALKRKADRSLKRQRYSYATIDKKEDLVSSFMDDREDTVRIGSYINENHIKTQHELEAIEYLSATPKHRFSELSSLYSSSMLFLRFVENEHIPKNLRRAVIQENPKFRQNKDTGIVLLHTEKDYTSHFLCPVANCRHHVFIPQGKLQNLVNANNGLRHLINRLKKGVSSLTKNQLEAIYKENKNLRYTLELKQLTKTKNIEKIAQEKVASFPKIKAVADRIKKLIRKKESHVLTNAQELRLKKQLRLARKDYQELFQSALLAELNTPVTYEEDFKNKLSLRSPIACDGCETKFNIQNGTLKEMPDDSTRNQTQRTINRKTYSSLNKLLQLTKFSDIVHLEKTNPFLPKKDVEQIQRQIKQTRQWINEGVLHKNFLEYHRYLQEDQFALLYQIFRSKARSLKDPSTQQFIDKDLSHEICSEFFSGTNLTVFRDILKFLTKNWKQHKRLLIPSLHDYIRKYLYTKNTSSSRVLKEVKFLFKFAKPLHLHNTLVESSLSDYVGRLIPRLCKVLASDIHKRLQRKESSRAVLEYQWKGVYKTSLSRQQVSLNNIRAKKLMDRMRFVCRLKLGKATQIGFLHPSDFKSALLECMSFRL